MILSAHANLAHGRIAQTLAAIERNIMARLQILEYPDPRLRTQAKPVEVFDAALAKLVEDMFETMYAAPGHRPGRHPGRLCISA